MAAKNCFVWGTTMNRRDMLKTLPLLGAGMAAVSPQAATKPQIARPLCLDYVNGIRQGIKKIRDTQMDRLHEASAAIARTKKAGGTCFYQWETDHTIEGDMFPGRHGDTDLFVMGYTMGNPTVQPKAGDLLLVNVIRSPLEDPRAKGIFVIGGPNPWCADTGQYDQLTEANRKLKIREYSDIWIELHYTPYGALIPLPGEMVPLGPTPGAYGMVTCWAMVADAVRLLARDGIPVAVKGDEPSLGKNEEYVRLDRPLAERYFAASLRRIGRIGDELDTITCIAAEATDRILAGGKLYVYSRNREALSAEANQRRGGLALINATWAEDTKFEGTNRDFMIMGITQPEDPVDLAMLDRFRGAGMKIAAIGPATRDGRKPSVRTVPGEADHQLGRMCDTYGLFAVPGLERKISPVSGLLVNVMFWTVAVRIAEEILARTGNAPGVLSTGAVVGGAEQRARKLELVKTRGY